MTPAMYEVTPPSGNPKPHKLKNDVTVFIPSRKAMRPDGTCFEGEGIRPDIEAKASPDKFGTGDPVLQRAKTPPATRP